MILTSVCVGIVGNVSVDEQVLVGWRHTPILLEHLFLLYSKETPADRDAPTSLPRGSQFPGVFIGIL